MPLVKPISLGQVVESITGRDLHKFYLVVGIQGHHILVSNGRDRSIMKPKKKNIRHVKTYNRIFSTIADRLNCSQHITDEEVRGALNVIYTR